MLFLSFLMFAAGVVIRAVENVGVATGRTFLKMLAVVDGASKGVVVLFIEVGEVSLVDLAGIDLPNSKFGTLALIIFVIGATGFDTFSVFDSVVVKTSLEVTLVVLFIRDVEAVSSFLGSAN